MRILLVEDDVVVRTTLEMMLTRLGFEVEVADCAEDGGLQFAEGAFDVVVSDYGLSGMNGLMFLRSIRDISPTTGTIIVSGLSARQCEDGGPPADRWLVKPIRLGDLSEALSSVIEAGLSRKAPQDD